MRLHMEACVGGLQIKAYSDGLRLWAPSTRKEESDRTFGENKRVFEFPANEFTQSSYGEPTFEMKSSKPRSEAGRSLRVPAELYFHRSTCRGGKREALSRCGAPLGWGGVRRRRHQKCIKSEESHSSESRARHGQKWNKREEQQRPKRATLYIRL